ncbi:MAG: hypothetical protein JKY52_15110 [Flavobacteriales bacterium]|nr:hypothetical protein [Flavobacteriales bacterium]
MDSGFFFNMIEKLRQDEEIMLYGNILKFDELEEIEVIEFLRNQYEAESMDYSHVAPAFDDDAALWGAKTIYTAAQLILYRKDEPDSLAALLPFFEGEFNSSSAVSVDLCLRFLPQMITQLKLIDHEDRLIEVLEKQLYLWHYSGVAYKLKPDKLDLSMISSDPCLHQLYVNRIIANRRSELAQHISNSDLVRANLGIYQNEFWKEFETTTTTTE